jgi:hypothetical protein
MLLKRASAVKDGTTAEHAAAAAAGHSVNAVEVLPARDYLVPTPKPTHQRRHRRARSTAEPRIDHDSGFFGDDEHDDIASGLSASSHGKKATAASVSPQPAVVVPAAAAESQPIRKPSRWGFWWGWGTLPEVRHEPATAAAAAATAKAAADAAKEDSKQRVAERRRARREKVNAERQKKLQKNKLRRVSDSVLDIKSVRAAVARTAAPLVAAPTPSTTAMTSIAPHHPPTARLPRLVVDAPVSPPNQRRLLKVVSERNMPGGVPSLLDDASNRTDSDSDNDTVFSMETDDGQHTDGDDVPPVPRSAAMPIAGALSALNDIPDDDNMLRHMSAPSPETFVASTPPVPHRTHTTSPPANDDGGGGKAVDAPQPRSSWFFWSRAPAAADAPPPQRSLSQSLEMPSSTSVETTPTRQSAAVAAAAASSSTEYYKEVRPAPQVLNALKLRYGRNDMAFTVTSALQGEKTVRASLYMWDWRTKIVISDIDGTITRSDVFGHVLPTLGRDWSHQGVARLFSNINRNGYEMLYLTSRPVGSAKRTRGYIASVTQDNVSLPEGPMLMSPERLLTALQVEVVSRRPDIFKTQCLTDILGLFPPHTKPFYAGFGNRPTDAIAYRAIGIARHKIFIIDHHGDVRTDNKTYIKTYTTLNEIIDDAFPSRKPDREVVECVEDEFNSFQFWRVPIQAGNKLPPLK